MRNNWNREYGEYLKAEHAKKVTEYSTQKNDKWTIKRIVIIGIGYLQDLYWLAIIFYMASIFIEKNGPNIPIYS